MDEQLRPSTGRDFVRLADMRLRPVKDPQPRDVTDLDPVRLLSQWLRWSSEAEAGAPEQLRMDTTAVLAAMVAAQGGLLRGTHDL